MSFSFALTLPPLPSSGPGSASSPLFVRPGTTRRFPLGTDIAGVRDLDAALSLVSGRTALAQRILRRLTTPRGGLVGSSTYGYDVTGLVGSTVPTSVVEQRVAEQALYEEEVDDALATVNRDESTGSLEVELRLVDAEGPFDFVLTASELTVSALINDVPIFEEAL